MNFGKALELLNRGKKVSRVRWFEYGDKKYLFFIGKKAFPVFILETKGGLRTAWAADTRDLGAVDWLHYDHNIVDIETLELEITASVERGHFDIADEKLILFWECVSRIELPAYPLFNGKFRNLSSFAQLRKSRLRKG